MDKITREFEHGKTVYDVEATVSGRHLEYLIDAADGKILGTEVPIEFSQLPEPVHAAADKYFGTTTGLIAMKGVEFGETHYEIEGTRRGKRAEVTGTTGGDGGPNHWEHRLRDPDGYTVVLASPDGLAS